MSILLDVSPRQQASQNSCWWCCIRMVLNYCGRHYTFPGQLHHGFTDPRTGSIFHWHQYPDRVMYPDWVDHPSTDVSNIDLSPEVFQRDTITHPSEWYQFGIPPQARAFQLLFEYTGFRGMQSRPAFGRWTGDDIERRLRRYGPFMFIGQWDGSTFLHAILVVGREETPEGLDEVIYIDPARGTDIRRSVAAFNRSMLNVGMQQYNPIYYPPAARRQRTRSLR